MRLLNEEVNIFLQNMRLAFDNIYRMNRYGFCHAQSKLYIGHVTEARLARREVDGGRRRTRQKRDSMVKELFPGYQPHNRKKSKEERWRLILVRYHTHRISEGIETMTPALRRRSRRRKRSIRAGLGCEGPVLGADDHEY
jgi:hypothetical protein